jgi:RNA polymerase sigma factor (sigma-70 family)
MMTGSQDQLTEWMNEAGRIPMLPKSETLRIAKLIQGLPADSSKRRKLVGKLVTHNMRLVVSFVHPFMRAKSVHKWGSPETLDYLQVGTMGLFKAAEKYDPSRGYAFSTYATHWIRSHVGRYNMKASSPFKISEEACRHVYYYEKHGKMNQNAHVGREWKENPERMCEIVKAAQAPCSIYAEADNGSMLIDYLQISQPEPIEFYDNKFNPEIEGMLLRANLNEMEDLIIRAVFLHSLNKDQVCSQYSISQGEYLKTKEKAIKKLRKIASPVTLGL